MAWARPGSGNETRARSPGVARGVATTVRSASSEKAGTAMSEAGAGAGIAVRPGSFTTAEHFGHLTLKGRSGTFASSIWMRVWHWGQEACTYLPLDQIVHPEIGSGIGAFRARAGAPAVF